MCKSIRTCASVFLTLRLYEVHGDPVSVVHYPEEACNLYPNPSHGFSTISGLQGQNPALRLFNSSGREVRYYPQLVEGETLDLSSLSRGLYHLQLLHQGEEWHSQKIIIHP